MNCWAFDFDICVSGGGGLSAPVLQGLPASE